MSSHQTSTYGSRVVVIQSSNRPSATYFGSSSSSQSSRYSTSSSSSQNSFSFSMNSSTSSQQIAEGRYRSGPAGAVGGYYTEVKEVKNSRGRPNIVLIQQGRPSSAQNGRGSSSGQ